MAQHGVIRLDPRYRRGPNGPAAEAELAAAVLRRALDDLTAPPGDVPQWVRHDAWAFFSGRSGGLEFWCQVAQVNPDAVRQRAQALLARQAYRVPCQGQESGVGSAQDGRDEGASAADV